MSRYHLSREAETDLDDIAEFSVAEFGVPRAKRYVEALVETFRLLTVYPRMGRPVGTARRGLRRTACGRHIVFYTVTAYGVLIVRVIHGKTYRTTRQREQR